MPLAWTDTLVVPDAIDGVPVFVIGREDYIANKKASGRAKDLADIEALGEQIAPNLSAHTTA